MRYSSKEITLKDGVNHVASEKHNTQAIEIFQPKKS